MLLNHDAFGENKRLRILTHLNHLVQRGRRIVGVHPRESQRGKRIHQGVKLASRDVCGAVREDDDVTVLSLPHLVQTPTAHRAMIAAGCEMKLESLTNINQLLLVHKFFQREGASGQSSVTHFALSSTGHVHIPHCCVLTSKWGHAKHAPNLVTYSSRVTRSGLRIIHAHSLRRSERAYISGEYHLSFITFLKASAHRPPVSRGPLLVLVHVDEGCP